MAEQIKAIRARLVCFAAQQAAGLARAEAKRAAQRHADLAAEASERRGRNQRGGGGASGSGGGGGNGWGSAAAGGAQGRWVPTPLSGGSAADAGDAGSAEGQEDQEEQEEQEELRAAAAAARLAADKAAAAAGAAAAALAAVNPAAAAASWTGGRRGGGGGGAGPGAARGNARLAGLDGGHPVCVARYSDGSSETLALASFDALTKHMDWLRSLEALQVRTEGGQLGKGCTTLLPLCLEQRHGENSIFGK